MTLLTAQNPATGTELAPSLPLPQLTLAGTGHAVESEHDLELLDTGLAWSSQQDGYEMGARKPEYGHSAGLPDCSDRSGPFADFDGDGATPTLFTYP